MIILAFETSCDDTSVAIFKDEQLLSLNTKSQIKVHNITNWVVPEVAAREHANNIFQVLNDSLKEAWISLEKIDYIAVTKTPWLMPSLLTWLTVARTLAKILNKKLIEINHIEAHIFANFLERKRQDINYPLVCLTISGGHNDLYYIKNMFDLEKIWSSNDDASWEAFDKVAKMMNLWYPWWPIISQLAKEYKEKAKNIFPRVWLKKDEFDFSFSWLKSAVKREIDSRIQKSWELTKKDKIEIAFEFEEAVIEVLSYKLIQASKQFNTKTIMLAWWVSANDKLINTIKSLAERDNLNFIYPKKKIYSWDNAAMVWINAFYKIKHFNY